MQLEKNFCDFDKDVRYILTYVDEDYTLFHMYCKNKQDLIKCFTYLSDKEPCSVIRMLDLNERRSRIIYYEDLVSIIDELRKDKKCQSQTL